MLPIKIARFKLAIAISILVFDGLDCVVGDHSVRSEEHGCNDGDESTGAGVPHRRAGDDVAHCIEEDDQYLQP